MSFYTLEVNLCHDIILGFIYLQTLNVALAPRDTDVFNPKSKIQFFRVLNLK